MEERSALAEAAEDKEGFDKERSDAVRNTRVASTLGRVMRASLNLPVEPPGEGSGRLQNRRKKHMLFADTSTEAIIE